MTSRRSSLLLDTAESLRRLSLLWPLRSQVLSAFVQEEDCCPRLGRGENGLGIKARLVHEEAEKSEVNRLLNERKETARRRSALLQ
jgi:hypothetical protein